MISEIRLKKNYFYVENSIKRTNDNKDRYHECKKEKVEGEVFEYDGSRYGIYRILHTADRRRKYDYVLVDLSTCKPIMVESRKIIILNELKKLR